MSFERICVSLVLASAFHTAALCNATAQSYPTRPIKFIVAYAAGGPVDLMARLVAQHLTPYLKQNVIVENRDGAAGVVGTKAVGFANPDGYTMLFSGSSNLVVAPLLNKNLGYDPLKDFVAVGQVTSTPHILVVNPNVPVHSVQELVAYAKANPGKLNYASPGFGSTPQLVAELFKWKTGTDLVHVPYKGGAPAMADLMAGHVQVFFENVTNVLPMARAGKVRALATTGETRSPDVPDLPTMVESGIDVVSYSWTGLFAPAATPREIIIKLNAAINETVTSREMAASIAKYGASPKTGSPGQFGNFLADEILKWGTIVKAAGIKAE
jgi:tripartite-type tricarboxylate transporter receptor subunit TctC